MTGSNSLINFGDLSKPATILVEKVCNAVGMVYEPTHIRRKARAEAEAERIKAAVRYELADVEHRAVERFVRQEARKQENIEKITAKAVEFLPKNADAQNLDEDWVAHFFKQCDTVSDSEMQTLWSRLLSGEASVPGTFSKRTVSFISYLDKKDAELFTKFCQFVWGMDDLAPLIYEINDEIYKKQGISFDDLKHLDAIGLISYEPIHGYIRTGFQQKDVIQYFEKRTNIEFSAEKKYEISIGHVIFTSVGEELFEICGAESNEDFYKYILNRLIGQGIILSSEFVSP